MDVRNAVRLLVAAAVVLLPGPSIAGGKYDGNWITNMSCDAQNETQAYRWQFPSVIKNGKFHGQHGLPQEPSYLTIDGKVEADGNAKLSVKGTVSKNNPHGAFAMKGNNFSYDVKAHFEDTHGSGTRTDGAGILGRSCTFDFMKQEDTDAATGP